MCKSKADSHPAQESIHSPTICHPPSAMPALSLSPLFGVHWASVAPEIQGNKHGRALPLLSRAALWEQENSSCPFPEEGEACELKQSNKEKMAGQGSERGKRGRQRERSVWRRKIARHGAVQKCPPQKMAFYPKPLVFRHAGSDIES